MNAFNVESWAAWAPALSAPEAWRDWAMRPGLPVGDSEPDVSDVPALARRRMSPLTRMALHVASRAGSGFRAADVPIVLASRHGEVQASLSMMRDILAERDLSPTMFSHSVHNAPAGQLSIHSRNQWPSSSVAGMQATFEAGLVEALGLAQRCLAERVLLVVADLPLPREYSGYADEPQVPHAMALLLRVGGNTASLCLEPRGDVPVRHCALPCALDFLAWHLQDGREWTAPSGWSAVRRLEGSSGTGAGRGAPVAG